MGFLKKHIIIIMSVLVLIIIVVIMLFHFGMNKKGKEDYIEMFYENKNTFEEISNSIISLEYDVSILKESGKIIVKQNKNAVEISKSSIDEQTKNNIKRAISDLDIRSINKINAYIEFIYSSKKDFHGIVYATDKNQLSSFTNVQHLEGNWYYCYIFNE